jgi:hypothetical protein
METACVIHRARNLYQCAEYLRGNEDDKADTLISESSALRVSECDFALPFPDKACSAQHSGFCPVTQDRAVLCHRTSPRAEQARARGRA